VLPINWSQFISQFPPDKPLPLLTVVAATTAINQPKSAFRQKLEAAAIGDRRALLLDHLRSQIAKVLDMSSAETIDPQLGFIELGMDSLMAVELSNRLRSSLECPVSAAIAFDYPTIESLVDYFDQTIATQIATQLATTATANAVAVNDKNNVAPEPTTPAPDPSNQTIASHNLPGNHTSYNKPNHQVPKNNLLAAPPATLRSTLEALSDSEAEALLISQLEAMRY
jgi:acyl carrier protein